MRELEEEQRFVSKWRVWIWWVWEWEWVRGQVEEREKRWERWGRKGEGLVWLFERRFECCRGFEGKGGGGSSMNGEERKEMKKRDQFGEREMEREGWGREGGIEGSRRVEREDRLTRSPYPSNFVTPHPRNPKLLNPFIPAPAGPNNPFNPSHLSNPHPPSSTTSNPSPLLPPAPPLAP